MTAVIVAFGVLLLAAVRMHVWWDDFPNPDIAGIVYSAEGLRAGRLPYVDTVDMKPPYAFFLVAGWISIAGRGLEALQLGHLLWAGVGGFGVGWAASVVYEGQGRPGSSRRATAMAVAVYLATVGMFTPNYSSWMTPAYAVAVGAALRGARNGGRTWPILAGAAAVVAVLTIQRAAALALLMPAAWWWARRRGWPGGHARTWIWWTVGGALAALPVVLPYAVAGQLGALASGIFPTATAAEYAASAEGSLVGNLAAGVGQIASLYWFPLALAVASVLATVGQGRDARATWVPALVGLAATFVGVSIGQRYYLHYGVQYAPVLAVLAVHPALVDRFVELGRHERGAQRESKAASRPALVAVAAAGLVILGFVVEVGLGKAQRYEALARRLEDGRTASQAAGAHIRERTDPDATIQAWGWTAWRIYYWAQRQCATPVFKPMGYVTTLHGSTAFSAGEGTPVTFRPGPVADAMIAAFDAAPPTYFVYSSSFVDTFGARPDPLEQFSPLRERLARDYALEAAYGDLRLLRRKAAPPGR